MHKVKKLFSILLLATICFGILAGCKKAAENVSSTAQRSEAASSAASLSDSEASSQVSSLAESLPQSLIEESSSSEPPPHAAPQFTETPVVTGISGKNVTVQFKTDISATVNAIVATSGEAIKVATFYDYLRRGVAYAPAAYSKQTHNVGPNGKSASFELPDLGQTYYLLLNAVEEVTDTTWQSSVTVIPLYDPSANAPIFVAGPVRAADEADMLVFTMETPYPTNIYILVTLDGATAPTAQQIKDGGTGYVGTSTGVTISATNNDKAPFVGKAQLNKTNFAAGSHSVWIVVQSSANSDWQLSAPVKVDFNI